MTFTTETYSHSTWWSQGAAFDLAIQTHYNGSGNIYEGSSYGPHLIML